MSDNKVIAAIAAVMGSVGSVKKEGTNSFHNYKYATAADVMHKLQPLMAENGLIIVQHQRAVSFIQGDAALAIEYEFHVMHSSGEKLDLAAVHTGVAAAKNSKGTPDDKAANKCHTAARKYFLLSLFQIPTGDYDDADADGDIPCEKEATKEPPQKTPPKAVYAFNACDGAEILPKPPGAFLTALGKVLQSTDNPDEVWGANFDQFTLLYQAARTDKDAEIQARCEKAQAFYQGRMKEINGEPK